jgi:hypothetical protein
MVAAAPRTGGGQDRSPAATARPDTTRQRTVVRPNRRSGRPEPHRRRDPLPSLAPGVAAAAYRDAPARETIARARAARFRQDSTLTNYDATVKQRLSVGLNVRAIGRDRLLFRSEVAARVRWNRPNLAWIDIIGARTAVPASFPGAKLLTGLAELVPIPYFSGSERLMWWTNLDGGDGDDDEHMFSYVHPLEDGAESVYAYRSGESASIRLPSGKAIDLQEVIVTAREPATDLISGSLWFESGAGQLVRAAFRPAAPVDMLKFIGEDSFDDVPAPVRAAVLNPYTFEVSSFTIDYGLHDERWWLPRSQTARGELRMGFIRSAATIDQSFRYAAVNGRDTLPTMAASRRRFGTDLGDDIGQVVTGVVDGVVPGTQFRRRRQGLDCPASDTAVHRQRRGGLRVTISMPCDTAAMLHSPALPPSIFDDGEQEFGLADARALAKQLDLDLATLGVSGSGRTTTTTLAYGYRGGLMRYNRVEGLSLGLRAERPLGRGWNGSALARLGTGDLEPNVELRASRGAEHRSLAAGAYHRLDSANDWGDPFGLGGSLSALLFGRDEGFYYRSSGAELTGARAASAATGVTWRLFAERQRAAPVETHLSLPNAFRGARFDPNIDAAVANQAGGMARVRAARGLDPRGLRLSADLRAEAAGGTFDYTRAAADLSASRHLAGNLGVALTLGAGTSGGLVPPQRLWRIGGTHTVRGFPAGALSGDSYWLGRAELGLGGSVLRPIVFYDAGWAGARAAWSASRGNVRGAGMGLSFMDGLARIDLARGVDPRTVWRAHLYVEAPF